MLLRSVSKHVKDQNWFAVFVDFLIVVVGVFIGIQVANWNENRAQNEQADGYMVQLADDIRSDLTDINTGYRTSQWRLAALTELLDMAGIPTPDKSHLLERDLTIQRPALINDSITYLMNASTYTRFLDNNHPSYLSLVNTGNATLIGKLKPWPCIQSYYAQYQEVLLFEERLLLFRSEMVRTLHDAGLSITGHVTESETLDRIRSHDSLSASMSSNRLFVYYHMLVLEDLGKRANLLLKALENNSGNCDFEEGSL
ncbi:DUF6090 family protein [Marinicella litoralis]|nr:DUF6090 family protein [Marinicella litoralis]